MRLLPVLLPVMLFASLAIAQDHTGHPSKDAPPPSKHHKDKAKDTPTTDMAMPESAIPMGREGSGTSWLPDSTRMLAWHAMVGKWMFMVHGNVFVAYDYQAGDRGDQRVMALGWLGAMASRILERGDVSLRTMFSVDPLNLGNDGYPLLLQSGEVVDGQPLHDRQHPHDLFMELALHYRQRYLPELGLELYAAVAGEPAVGPPAFPHRPSAFSEPLAPLSHHWQDSTHISFGVLTAGVFGRMWKIEGSWFNGREPDEERFNIDFRAFDSFAARLSINPTADLSLQVSYAFLESPEELEPDESVHRVTASVLVNRPIWREGTWAGAILFGMNLNEDVRSPSITVESNVDFDTHHQVFGRIEYVRKEADHLVLPGVADDVLFDVGSLSLGYRYAFSPLGPVVLAVGARASIGLISDELSSFYGMRVPAGFAVFFQSHLAPMADETMSH